MPSFVISFAIASAYWFGISGAATSPRWIIAATVLSGIMFFRPDPIRMTLPHVLGLIYLAWCGATFFWSEEPGDSIGALWQMAACLAAFCVGSTKANPIAVYKGAAAGLGVSALFAIAQTLGWHGLLEAASPAGLFVNRNFYAEACALVAVALIAERLWWWLIPVAPGLLLTNARGAWLALIVSCGLILWKHSRKAALASVVLGLCFLIVMSFDGSKLTTIAHRFDLWNAALSVANWHGYGIGTFWQSAPQPMWINYHSEHAHNEFIEAVFETGYVGCALLIAFIASLLWGSFTTGRLVLIALVVEAIFEFPFHEPATAVLGCCVAGSVAGSLRGVLDQARDCRDRIQAGFRRWSERPGNREAPA